MIRLLTLGFLSIAIVAYGSAPVLVPNILSEDSARFTTLLRSRVAERRIEGVQGLSQMKHWPAEPQIAEMTRDGNAGARREAVLALGRIGTAASVPVLIDALTNTDWEVRENARLALPRLTGHACESCDAEQWRAWWGGSSLDQKQQQLFAIVKAARTNAPLPEPQAVLRRGKLARPVRASVTPPVCEERRDALRALRHMATSNAEDNLVGLLARPQTPPLDADERLFVCETLERVGTSRAVSILAGQHTDAAAWALGRIGGPEAESALLRFPPTIATLLALDRLHSTNTAGLIPFLIQNMAQITYRSHPDDVMNDDLQPIQRAGVNLIRRSGFAPMLIEAVLQELENTMKPPIPHGAVPQCPAAWQTLLTRMHSELKPGFVREDGVTTSQPLVTLCYLADDPSLAARLIPLLKHPAVVVRVYVALALGRLHAADAVPALTSMIEEGYGFSDSTALASGKHFDQSQTVRWKGFLCMALGRLGSEPARSALERYVVNAGLPRDIRYSSIVGLRFVGSPKSLPALRQAAEQDVIWMIRDEAHRACENIEVLATESFAKQEATQ